MSKYSIKTCEHQLMVSNNLIIEYLDKDNKGMLLVETNLMRIENNNSIYIVVDYNSNKVQLRIGKNLRPGTFQQVIKKTNVTITLDLNICGNAVADLINHLLQFKYIPVHYTQINRKEVIRNLNVKDNSDSISIYYKKLLDDRVKETDNKKYLMSLTERLTR